MRGRPKTSPQKARRVNPNNIQPPRLYVNGFPKAGLHLAVRMALPLFSSGANGDTVWFGTNAWTVRRDNLDLAVDKLESIRDGQYLIGHSGYLPELEQLFDALRYVVLLVYRDLRDVVVSQTYHILSDNPDLNHPWKDRYDGLSKEEIMIAAIEGIADMPGIFERWETYKGWFGKPIVHLVRFEDLIKKPYHEAKRFFERIYGVALYKAGIEEAHLDKELKGHIIDDMVYQMKQRHLSVTYRKGKTGQWKREFTPAVVKAFKAADVNNELYQLGYVKGIDW